MSTKKVKRSAAREQRVQEQAQKVIKGIFVGLIILAVLAIACFSIWG